MKKRYYFLSILILFLFNINKVDAVTSYLNYGNSSNANSYCIGDNCSLPISHNLVSWSGGIPGSLNGTFYMYINISPNDITIPETDYRNAVLEYHFCNSTQNINFNIVSNHTPPWKYSYKQTAETCVGMNGASGYKGTYTMFSDFTGTSSASDFAKVSANTTVNAWWSYFLGYDIYKLDTYYELKEQEEINSNLNDLNDKQQQTNDKLNDLNDNITDSDSSEASGEASDFFSGFDTDTFGLTSVITAPLELIKSITSKTCTPLQLTVPFVDKQLNLPCLSSIYEQHFGSFLTIYRTITFGFVSYWVCIKLFNLVKDFKNPEHDEIEVLDL